jgi:hypothetical protein
MAEFLNTCVNMGYGDGPSAMGYYDNAGPESRPADVGTARAMDLEQRRFADQQRYAAPYTGNQNGPTFDRGATGFAGVPSYYNEQPALPVKYSIPTEEKENMIARQAIRAAAKADSVVVHRTDPITDGEVQYLRAMQDQAELADFDRYVQTLIDPRKPGEMRWLMEVYPDFVTRRIAQVHTDYEYAVRNQMIDAYGINTFDDLHFKYLVDQGKISGPMLKHKTPKGLGYHTGSLAPGAFNKTRYEGVRLPFASAQTGAHAANDAAWTMRDAAQPLGVGRGMRNMATNMYANTPTASANDDETVANGIEAAGNTATSRLFPLAVSGSSGSGSGGGSGGSGGTLLSSGGTP